MVDPVILAVVTSALTQLASKAAEGSASEAGKDLWKAVMKRLGWSTDPSLENLSLNIAKRLKDDEELANDLTSLLKAKFCRSRVSIPSGCTHRCQQGRRR